MKKLSRARRLAKAILADGKWSHDWYNAKQRENLITRVISIGLKYQRQELKK